MGQVHIEAARVIGARPEAIYAVLADYKEGHLAILPKQFFKEFVVEKGGSGAGTVFRGTLSVYGVVNKFHMMVSEPEPGRVMIETDTKTGTTTTFTVDPVGDGSQSRVTMASAVKLSPGLMGMVEKRLSPLLLVRALRAELAQLDEYVCGKVASD